MKTARNLPGYDAQERASADAEPSGAERWTICGDDNDYVCAPDHPGAGNVVCAMPDIGMDASRALWPERSHLIAASPELYAAAAALVAADDCRDRDKVQELFERACALARAALAKASPT